MKTYRPGRLQVHARALKFPHDPWFVSPPFRRCAHPTLSHKNCCTSPKSVVFELSRPVPAPHFGCRLFSAKFFNLTYAAPALREVHCSTLHRRSCGIWFTYSYPWLSSIILSGIQRATALAGVWCFSSVYEKARFYMKTYRRGRLQVHARALKFPHDPWFVSPPSRRVCTCLLYTSDAADE